VARNGLRYDDVEVGTGRRVNKGDTILCYYSGSYKKKGSNPFTKDETVVFDETKPGEPIEFVVGQGQLIPGMDMGIPGSIDFDIPPMNIGGDRRLVVPSALAYGAAGVVAPPDGDNGNNGNRMMIPPNQDLEFQIAVLSAESRQGVSME
jgi:FKBP-type peptidyl-prolyl cis-trans isomerase